MSVLIKEMKMPKGCCDCPIWPLCFNEKPKIYDWKFTLRRLERCPLAEVPTPHGRLIDADELRKKMIKEADHYAPYIHEGIRHGYHNCELLVDDAPIVIESEK